MVISGGNCEDVYAIKYSIVTLQMNVGRCSITQFFGSVVVKATLSQQIFPSRSVFI